MQKKSEKSIREKTCKIYNKIMSKELEEKDKIISELEHRINTILNSTSWKITYPFRFFKDKIIRFKNRFKIKTKIRNYKEFNKFKNKNKNIQEICKEITSFLNEKKEIVHYPISAKCEICGYKGEFCCSKIVLPEANFVAFSELFSCPMCDLNNRQRSSMKIFLDKIKNKKNKSIFLYEQITPYFNVLSKNVSNNNIIGSEFLGYQHKSGDVINGVRNEDGMNLSLKDNSVDYVISNDVFEHIPDINKTFSEASRVLKSGGELIFTIPFHYDKDKTITRAIFKNNEIKNILPPIYHGNPVDIEGGSLCFHDFGWDILDIIKSCGFSDVYGIPTYNKENAHIHYDPIMTYIAIKK